MYQTDVGMVEVKMHQLVGIVHFFPLDFLNNWTFFPPFAFPNAKH